MRIAGVTRLVGALLVVVAAAASSCGVRVRQPASLITETSAVLERQGGLGDRRLGELLLGLGSCRELGPADRGPERRVRPRQHAARFVAVERLVPGARSRYRLCVSDSENPGGGNGCSPTQTFRTLGPVAPTFRAENRECAGPNDVSQGAYVVNFQPNTTYAFRGVPRGRDRRRQHTVHHRRGRELRHREHRPHPAVQGARADLAEPQRRRRPGPRGENGARQDLRSDEPCADAQPEEPSAQKAEDSSSERRSPDVVHLSTG